MGETSEFFSGVPSFSRCFGNGFFVLECETTTKSRRIERADESVVSAGTYLYSNSQLIPINLDYALSLIGP